MDINKFDFINKFKILKNKMNVNESHNIFFRKKDLFYAKFIDLTKEIQDGKDVELNELLIIKEIFLLNGIPVVIYIKDHSNSNFKFKKFRKKVHLINCTTIKEMKIAKRLNRYVSTTRIDEIYNISVGKKTIKKSLEICKNCIKELYLKEGVRVSTVNSFFNLDIILKNFNERDVTYNENTNVSYPPNWKKISYQLRKNNNWNCQRCYNNFEKDKHNLHVHHKDGVKQDTSLKNLEILCYKCHSDEPFHEHMKKQV